MSVFSSFQSPRRRKPRANKTAPRRLTLQLQIEYLEDRNLLSATSLAVYEPTTASAEISLEPTFSEQPVVRVPEISKQLSTHDAGDFYWHFEEQVPLLRRNDEILVGLRSEADRAAVIDALAGRSGLTLDDRSAEALNSRTLLLSRELAEAGALDVFSDVKDFALSLPGVAWTAPVLVGKDSLAKVYLTDEVGIALKPDIDPAKFFVDGFSSWYRFFDNQYIATVKTGGGLSALELANELSTDSRVEWATPNFNSDYRVAAVPDDPMFQDQWNLSNTGQTGALSGADAELPDAWDITTGGFTPTGSTNSRIVVAVLDNGVQLDHPDLDIFVNVGEIPGDGLDNDSNGYSSVPTLLEQ